MVAFFFYSVYLAENNRSRFPQQSTRHVEAIVAVKNPADDLLVFLEIWRKQKPYKSIDIYNSLDLARIINDVIYTLLEGFSFRFGKSDRHSLGLTWGAGASAGSETGASPSFLSSTAGVSVSG